MPEESLETAQSDMTPLIETVKLMADELKELRADVNTKAKRKNSSTTAMKTSTKRGCDYCKRNNCVDTCRHCWICGAGDHMSYKCEKRGNEQ